MNLLINNNCNSDDKMKRLGSFDAYYMNFFKRPPTEVLLKNNENTCKTNLSDIKSNLKQILLNQEIILSRLRSIEKKLKPLLPLPERVSRLKNDVLDLKYRRNVGS